MKKSKKISLSLNRKVISKLDNNNISGGGSMLINTCLCGLTDTCTLPIVCVSEGSICQCL